MTVPEQQTQNFVTADRQLDDLLSMMRGRAYSSFDHRRAILILMLTPGSQKENVWLAATAIERLLEAEAGS